MCWLFHTHFFIWIETENHQKDQDICKGSKGTDWVSHPRQKLCPSHSFVNCSTLEGPLGNTKDSWKRRPVQLTDKKPSLCPVPWTWTLLNTICLNNDQNIIDMMRLPRARPFNSAWLRGKKERMKKPTLTWPWHASLGSDFPKWSLNWNPKTYQF